MLQARRQSRVQGLLRGDSTIGSNAPLGSFLYGSFHLFLTLAAPECPQGLEVDEGLFIRCDEEVPIHPSADGSVASHCSSSDDVVTKLLLIRFLAQLEDAPAPGQAK
ncbi:MAG: hypothetical protein RJB38_1924 [Pseudomonadota bacterium]|jgi:hypothetical protein